MIPNRFATISARNLAAKVKSAELAADSAANEYLERIAEADPKLNHFITIEQQYVQGEIERLQGQLKSDADLPLAGVPIAVKDNISTKGLRTTCGSAILENYRPVYDAEVVCRIKRAGGIVIGKTNCDEFGMGSTNETSHFGPAINPINRNRVTGGSSGGSAGCVAAGTSLLALGSDTGGSIRQPSSFCGVVGLKPTYGRISRFGLVAYASSLDQIGPIGRTIDDVQLLYSVIAGYDPKDATSVDKPQPVDRLASSLPPAQIKVAVLSTPPGSVNHPSVDQTMGTTRAIIEADGVSCASVSLALIEFGVAAYYIIATAESSSNLARFDGIRYGKSVRRSGDTYQDVISHSRTSGFGAEVKKRIMTGTFVLSRGYFDAFYGQACKLRLALRRQLDELLDRYDFILLPNSPVPPFELGAGAKDPQAMYLADLYTTPASLAGLPALSIPCGEDDDGLPVGLQIIGRRWCEMELLAFGRYIERSVQRTKL